MTVKSANQNEVLAIDTAWLTQNLQLLPNSRKCVIQKMTSLLGPFEGEVKLAQNSWGNTECSIHVCCIDISFCNWHSSWHLVVGSLLKSVRIRPQKPGWGWTAVVEVLPSLYQILDEIPANRTNKNCCWAWKPALSRLRQDDGVRLVSKTNEEKKGSILGITESLISHHLL